MQITVGRAIENKGGPSDGAVFCTGFTGQAGSDRVFLQGLILVPVLDGGLQRIGDGHLFAAVPGAVDTPVTGRSVSTRTENAGLTTASAGSGNIVMMGFHVRPPWRNKELFTLTVILFLI
jgi:hypothetical protein